MAILDFRTVFRFYEQYADFTNCVSVLQLVYWISALFVGFTDSILFVGFTNSILFIGFTNNIYSEWGYKKVFSKNLKERVSDFGELFTL